MACVGGPWLTDAQAQGCVAVRSTCGAVLPGAVAQPMERGWQASISYRYLYADRYFMGDDELPMPPGSQVINEVHTIDVAVTYAINSRWSITADLPIQTGDRTTRHEHLGMDGPQYTTSATGIGDFRLTADYWLRDPSAHPRWNVAVGLGLKAPTGDDAADDEFVTPAGTVERPVDIAIQPGDGGWGAIAQAQGYYTLTHGLSAYANGFYLFNPEDVNGTASFSPDDFPNQDNVNSIADQYLLRLGLNYVVLPKAGLSVSIGGRFEGVPARDVIGADTGFRRPGFTVSIEPGLSWVHGKNSLSLTAPVALLRNRERSVTDDLRGTHGDASFADFLLLFTYTRQF